MWELQREEPCELGGVFRLFPELFHLAVDAQMEGRDVENNTSLAHERCSDHP